MSGDTVYLEIMLRGDIRHFVDHLFAEHNGSLPVEEFNGALVGRFNYSMVKLVDAAVPQEMDPAENGAGVHYFPVIDDMVHQQGQLVRRPKPRIPQ